MIEKVFMCVYVCDRKRDRLTEEISKNIKTFLMIFIFYLFTPPVDEHMTKNRVRDGSNRLCSKIKKKWYRNKYWTLQLD